MKLKAVLTCISFVVLLGCAKSSPENYFISFSDDNFEYATTYSHTGDPYIYITVYPRSTNQPYNQIDISKVRTTSQTDSATLGLLHLATFSIDFFNSSAYDSSLIGLYTTDTSSNTLRHAYVFMKIYTGNDSKKGAWSTSYEHPFTMTIDAYTSRYFSGTFQGTLSNTNLGTITIKNGKFMLPHS